MEIKTIEGKDQLTIQLIGSLETGSSSQLEVEVDKIIKKTKSIVLDFAKLDYISSAGLRVLLTIQRSCDARGTKLKIINANDVVKEVFELTGFNTVLHIG